MKLLICGIGAIGSNLTRVLTADNLGKWDITILDFDKVEKRNLMGTQYYFPNQEGLFKVEALQFNIYQATQKEISIINQKLTLDNLSILSKFNLCVDCLDNCTSRRFVQDYCTERKIPIIHCGFSDNFTFSIEHGTNYKTPSDLASDFDICTMQGAGAFVNSVASLGALVVEEFIFNKRKLEVVGGRFTHSLIK